MKNRTDVDKFVTDVTRFLQQRQGIVAARALSVADSAQLLEPWLGQTDALSALPIPRIVAVELDRSNPPDFDLLRADLSREFKDVTLDDKTLQVIGVMPGRFENVLASAAEIWAPLQYSTSLTPDGREWGHHLRMIARLRPGIGLDRARRV